jgi:hypothetical protein
VTRLERIALAALLAALVACLVVRQPVAGLLGALAGTAAGLALADRFARVPRGGFRLEVVLRRALLQIGVLGVLLVLTALTPFVSDRSFGFAAAALTALPAALTVQRLRG